MNYSKVLVTAIVLLNVAFTIAVFYVFLKTSAEPTSLVVAWFGFTTVELWNMAKIKVKKTENTKTTKGRTTK